MKTEVCLAFIVMLAFASRVNGDKDQNDLENRKLDSQIMSLLLRRQPMCCLGPCIRNPRFSCCNPCATSGHINMRSDFGNHNANQWGDNNKNSNGNREDNEGKEEDHDKREWMSETN